MTYNELISRFTIYDNPPKKDGYDRHHIVPTCEQKKSYGNVTDNRQIYVSLPMHMWLHILYDKENGTNTAKKFTAICNKPAEYFDCWEKCLAYSYTLRKKKEEQFKKAAEAMKTPEVRQKIADSMKEVMKNPERRQKQSDSMKGEKNPMKRTHRSEETKRKIANTKKGKPGCNKGRKWFNDGTKSVMVYSCPEGFVEGMLNRRTI